MGDSSLVRGTCTSLENSSGINNVPSGLAAGEDELRLYIGPLDNEDQEKDSDGNKIWHNKQKILLKANYIAMN
jgi:hypothetical protein